MELNTQFFSEQVGKIKGVCHAGSHSGQEVQDYISGGVETIVWIEANYKILNRLIKHTAPYGKNQIWYCQCLWDQDNVVKSFNISNNDGESSSVLNFGEGHISSNPHIHYVENMILLTKRMDTIVKSQTDFSWSDINMIVTDCQGADLEVLKGFGDLLSSPNVKIIKSEVGLNEQYKNGSTHEKIDEYLSKFGFSFEWYFHTPAGWGDHYWVRR